MNQSTAALITCITISIATGITLLLDNKKSKQAREYDESADGFAKAIWTPEVPQEGGRPLANSK